MDNRTCFALIAAIDVAKRSNRMSWCFSRDSASCNASLIDVMEL
jgi:hypothetical protein